MSYVLRTPCRCGSSEGEIRTTNGQDCVYCQCGKYQYNAPKTETGRKPRSVSATHSLVSPKQKSRVIKRANTRCERCGKPAVKTQTGLQVGHILSVADGLKLEVPDHLINSDDNLIAECDECNLGHRETLPLQLVAAILKAREGDDGFTLH